MSTQETTEQVIQRIHSYEFGQSREPLTRVEDIVAMVNNHPLHRRAVAAQLAAVLGGGATLHAKQFVCRQLGVIGSEAEVPALAALLNDVKTADMARYALEGIPSQATERALFAALDTAPDEARVGILNSLGRRGGNYSVRRLAGIAQDSEPAESEAAMAALACIGTPRAKAALCRVQRRQQRA